MQISMVKYMNLKNGLIVGILIIVIIVPLSLAKDVVTDTENQALLHPSFPSEFLVIIGKYTSIESNQNSPKQSLIIQCNPGKILVFGGVWAKATQYGSWVFSPFICAKVSSIEAPCFYGFYYNNRICGVTFGDWQLLNER